MDKERVKTFAAEVFEDMAGAMTAGLGFIGIKTGLFQSMAGKGWMSSSPKSPDIANSSTGPPVRSGSNSAGANFSNGFLMRWPWRRFVLG